MKKLIPILLSLTLVGCTTGSKYKYIENNYTNVQSFGQTGSGTHQFNTPEEMDFLEEPRIQFLGDSNPHVVERPVYIYDEQDATMGDLGKAIGKKLLRKMYAAYNTN